MDGDGSKKVKTRVNRIAGQVAGIQRMVDEGRYCVEILNQIAAVRSALDALGIELLTRHLESCVLGHGDRARARQGEADDEGAARRRGPDGPLPVPEIAERRKVDMMETTFTAPGISCQGCANTIEKALGSIPDVSGVSVDVPGKRVTVSHGDRVGRETLEGASPAPAIPRLRAGTTTISTEPAPDAATTVKDPVCGMNVDPAAAAGKSEHEGTTYFFCSTSCKQKFDSDPTRYLSPAEPGALARCRRRRPLHLPDAPGDRPGQARKLPDLRHGPRADDGHRRTTRTPSSWT